MTAVSTNTTLTASCPQIRLKTNIQDRHLHEWTYRDNFGVASSRLARVQNGLGPGL